MIDKVEKKLTTTATTVANYVKENAGGLLYVSVWICLVCVIAIAEFALVAFIYWHNQHNILGFLSLVIWAASLSDFPVFLAGKILGDDEETKEKEKNRYVEVSNGIASAVEETAKR
jgi:hypothetical protein